MFCFPVLFVLLHHYASIVYVTRLAGLLILQKAHQKLHLALLVWETEKFKLLKTCVIRKASQ